MIIKVDHTIELVPNDIEHAQQLLDAVNSCRPYLATFLPWVPVMKNKEDFINYLLRCNHLQQQGLEYSYNIFENKTLIGRVGLSYINDANKIANIGYWLVENKQGKGIMNGSVRAIINYGFEQLHLNRLEIKAILKNTRSRAIPEKLGFTFEGILRQAEFVNNTFHDLALYSLLRKEWMYKVS